MSLQQRSFPGPPSSVFKVAGRRFPRPLLVYHDRLTVSTFSPPTRELFSSNEAGGRKEGRRKNGRAVGVCVVRYRFGRAGGGSLERAAQAGGRSRAPRAGAQARGGRGAGGRRGRRGRVTPRARPGTR